MYAKGAGADALPGGDQFGSPRLKQGCTDPKATNYDKDAKIDDGSCTYVINDKPTTSETEKPAKSGCTDFKATNYDSTAIFDDGSCTYLSQTPTASPTTEPITINGCTDPAATNYDGRANKNDGSCRYPETTIRVDTDGTITTIKDGEVTGSISTGGYGGGGFGGGGGMTPEEELPELEPKRKNKFLGFVLLAGLAYVTYRVFNK
jgi:hypothetical protein